MKRKMVYIFLLFIGLISLFLFYNPVHEVYAVNSSCYLCKDGSFVCYGSSDTLSKRQKAKEKFKCEIAGTTTCSDIHCNGRYVLQQ